MGISGSLNRLLSNINNKALYRVIAISVSTKTHHTINMSTTQNNRIEELSDQFGRQALSSNCEND